MKSDKKILLAFLLNTFFAVFEFVGGAFTGSIAIVSDAIHALGDAFSIGVSYVLERLGGKKADSKYTYGYYRYSVLGGVIQSVILLCGSVLVVYNAALRLLHPAPVDYSGMIVIAVIGFFVNFAAAYFTSGGHSINQKAINLHMLEDVLGWAVVLAGAVIMRFTDWWFLDPALSIGLAVFIGVNALKNLKAVLDIFLQKIPKGMDAEEIMHHLLEIDGVESAHHLHIWSMDGYRNAATVHIVTDGDIAEVKKAVREELTEHGISHTTVECERTDEVCPEVCCELHSYEPEQTHYHHQCQYKRQYSFHSVLLSNSKGDISTDKYKSYYIPIPHNLKVFLAI